MGVSGRGWAYGQEPSPTLDAVAASSRTPRSTAAVTVRVLPPTGYAARRLTILPACPW